MLSPAPPLIFAVVIALASLALPGNVAHADEAGGANEADEANVGEPAPGAPAPVQTAQLEPMPPVVTAAPAPAPSAPQASSTAVIDDALLAAMAQGEVIEVWDERADKPFDRDTELRITGAELARRGASNLADALAFVPEINARNVNRGGTQIDVRGARKGSLKIFIDGIPVSDPYRGNFDISSIPITDVVEVRVSTTPASPIDGTGGPGGVIEVHTRDAIGGQVIGIRADVNTLPQAMAAASASSMIARHLAVRVSATGDIGRRDLSVVLPEGQPGRLDEDRQNAGGAMRLEYRKGTRRGVLDVAARTGGYIVPPSEAITDEVVHVAAADDARVGLAVDDQAGRFRLQGRAYGYATRKNTEFFADATMAEVARVEDATAATFGGRFLVNRPIGNSLELLGSASLDAEDGRVERENGGVTGGRATIAALASGFELKRDVFRVDGSAGVALPLDIGASPWPEGKLSVKLTPTRMLTTRLVGGYKGRLPTLQERFDSGTGNAALGPEKALFAEAGVRLEKNHVIEADLAVYERRSSGMIRYSAEEMSLINLGELTIRGADARATVFPLSPIHGGGSVSVLNASSAEFGDDPIDRLPERRGDLWLSGRYRTRLGGMMRLSYIGEMVDQSLTLPDYVLLDTSMYVRINPALMTTLRVDNLLNERYLDRASGVLGIGRTVILSMQGHWE